MRPPKGGFQLATARLRELTRLDLEAILPVAPPQTLHKITPRGQPPRFPLLHHMAVLVEHELGIPKEFRSAPSEVNPPSPRRGVITGMQPGEQRMLDHPHMIHPLPEHGLERCEYRRRDGN